MWFMNLILIKLPPEAPSRNQQKPRSPLRTRHTWSQLASFMLCFHMRAGDRLGSSFPQKLPHLPRKSQGVWVKAKGTTGLEVHYNCSARWNGEGLQRDTGL